MTIKRWLDKPYNNLNDALRQKFGKKIIKLSVDGGFSCPNRDGRVGIGGCLFCTEQGSGEFSGDCRLNITAQLEQQIELLRDKWPEAEYIAYFQSFSNTYGDLDYMERQFRAAMTYPGVVGLAIATRVDCIGEEVLKLLTTLSQETYIWVEMGLQSVYAHHHKLLNTGYTPDQFSEATIRLAERGIDVVGHIILGLPDTPETVLDDTVDFLNRLPLAGVKLHMLNVLRGTALAALYASKPFELLSMEHYLEQVRYIIERLRPDIVVHRVTGDGAKALLIEPTWILNKRHVLNTLLKAFSAHESYQGKYFR
ncbi:MAG: TIGR01212 family radical SAM protein [Clostridia bacterium]|nr:TIGR01212 family radical SAM protein [Clostridia bacterium]